MPITIITGHFGSGKTEIALNLAFQQAEKGKCVQIYDIDVVNPYFCSKDKKEELEKQGIEVIASPKELSNAELSVVPAEFLSIFSNQNKESIVDVGGDDMGATVLSQYRERFEKCGYEMYFVINTKRLQTSTAEDIENYILAIEKASRLKITHLINNTNLGSKTTIDHILQSYAVVKEVSLKTNLPVKYTVVKAQLASELKAYVDSDLMEIKIFMLPEWLQ